MTPNLRALARRIRLALTGRIDCAPRTERNAPYPELDRHGGFWVVVEPLSRYRERVWWSGGNAASSSYTRWTEAYWNERDDASGRNRAIRARGSWAHPDAEVAR